MKTTNNLSGCSRYLTMLFVATQLSRAAAIHGIVTDDRGRPVAGVWVTADNLMAGSRVIVRASGQQLGHGTIPETITDERGRFTIAGVAPDKYWLFTHKEESGYGDTGTTIYAAGRPAAPEVTLSDAAATAEVTINLGRPAGFLLSAWLMQQRCRTY
jgi:protocatechuate 3,4-dioxygenase beta subunit